MQTIEVTISKAGEVTMHVIGVQGESCLGLTKPLEDALAGELVSRELTDEAHEEVEQSVADTQRATW